MKKNKNQLYIQANRDWLVAESQEDGVRALPKGVFYKVLAEGDVTSATPTPGSVITAHYTGKTIDGASFDSSRGDVPLACRLRDLIEGWIIAMQQMHIGDILTNSSFCRLKPLSKYDKHWCFERSRYLQRQIDVRNCSIAHFAG